ncbi:MAG: LysM peptidoglycan-binding domain-containing protein, partial [Oscillospiraceae bacterium]|nr:LysM peptidoglycan-binding domain-containing protein [Oscillospiraceae bacterium]
QVVATSKRKLRYIADAYSTKNNLELKPQPTQFTEFSEPHVVSAVLRGTIPAPNAARVVSLTANAGATTVEHSNGEVSAKTPVTVKALYSDNDGALRTAVSKFEANTALPNANSANVLAHVSTGRDTYGAASDGAIEIRVPIELRANEVVSPELSPIASVAYDETAPSDNTQKPSLVIARAKRGDTLWSVAKRYSATREHVRDVNALEDENIGEGSMLVIPRKK